MLYHINITELHSPSFFFFNDTATTEIYTLSLHDALPIYQRVRRRQAAEPAKLIPIELHLRPLGELFEVKRGIRSEEHTSELQSRQYLVCRLLLEKKKKNTTVHSTALPLNPT